VVVANTIEGAQRRQPRILDCIVSVDAVERAAARSLRAAGHVAHLGRRVCHPGGRPDALIAGRSSAWSFLLPNVCVQVIAPQAGKAGGTAVAIHKDFVAYLAAGASVVAAKGWGGSADERPQPCARVIS